MKADIVIHERSILGEGAIWDHKSQVLHWVDIEGKKLNCYNPTLDKNDFFNLPQQIGTVVPCVSGKLLIALEDGLYFFNQYGILGECIQKIEDSIPTNRCNDGKCDSLGRFWVGTMPMAADKPVGSLYCYSLKTGIKKELNKLTVSNGLAWDRNNETIYFIDTLTSAIDIYEFDNHSGTILQKKGTIKIPKSEGFPDGMTIDSDGLLWVALWAGAGVIRCNPKTLKIEDKITLNAKNVTSCSFGGKDLSTLYITTATSGLTGKEILKFPDSGKLLSLNVGVKGVKTNYFNDRP